MDMMIEKAESCELMGESLQDHFNAIGSTVAMTNQNQTIVNSYSYDPFGNIVAQNESVPQPFKYVGQYGVMQEPNGFYYMRARYYDPKVGRFISEDPIGFKGGTVNLYEYAKNNPTRFKDPFGKAWWWIIEPVIHLGIEFIELALAEPLNEGEEADIEELRNDQQEIKDWNERVDKLMEDAEKLTQDINDLTNDFENRKRREGGNGPCP